MRRPGEVLSRLHLLEHAWDFAYENRSNVSTSSSGGCGEDRRAVRRAHARDGAWRRLPTPGRRLMSRLPIRLRITAAFAVAMAVVLAGSGSSCISSLGSHLALALDRELQLRAQDLAALVSQPNSTLARDSTSRFVERGESYAQLVAATVACSMRRSRSARAPVLDAAEVRAARRGAGLPRQAQVAGLNESSRVLATTVTRAAAPASSSSAPRCRTAPRRWPAFATSC